MSFRMKKFRLKEFRDFGRFKGLVIDPAPIKGIHRVALADGEIRKVSVEELKNSEIAKLFEVDEKKLRVLHDEYTRLIKSGDEYIEESFKDMAEDWRRVLVDDEIVDKEDFNYIFKRELIYRTYGEIHNLGYKITSSELNEGTLVYTVYKKFKLSEKIKRYVAKLLLVGLSSKEIQEGDTFIDYLDEFMKDMRDELFHFDPQTNEWGITLNAEFLPEFENYTLTDMCSVKVEGVPLTRELAIEAAERVIGKCKIGSWMRLRLY